MIQDIAIVTMEGEYDLVCDLSNGAISYDLERTLTLFSRSHHSLTLNISQTATDMVIVTMKIFIHQKLVAREKLKKTRNKSNASFEAVQYRQGIRHIAHYYNRKNLACLYTLLRKSQ